MQFTNERLDDYCEWLKAEKNKEPAFIAREKARLRPLMAYANELPITKDLLESYNQWLVSRNYQQMVRRHMILAGRRVLAWTAMTSQTSPDLPNTNS